MFKYDHPQKTPLFDYFAPLGESFRGLLSIPHSGEHIPSVFEPYLSANVDAYRSDVDFKVHELIHIPALQRAGVAILVAHTHRICVDLNRAESNCVLFWKTNTQGQTLVVQEPTPEKAQGLIETFHRPYFEILKSALRELEKQKKGSVSMIDLHSMPSRPTAYHLQQNPQQKTHRPDFCLSDRKGLTCAPEFISFFQSSLAQKGYEAMVNDPYVGGYVTEYVNQFRSNNIQIEIKRSLYMDEKKRVLLKDKVKTLRDHLTEILIDGFGRFDS